MARIDVYTADGELVSTHDTDPDGNEATIRQQARQALTTNRAFLDLASPTNAQTLAQVKHLTRVTSALIRMELADYTAAD
jgi:hypothetical protein